jgi:hypothetical protein
MPSCASLFVRFAQQEPCRANRIVRSIYVLASRDATEIVDNVRLYINTNTGGVQIPEVNLNKRNYLKPD